MHLVEVRKKLKRAADKEKAKILARFFKTGPGEYAQGDMFVGVTVPSLRKIAKESESLSLTSTIQLLKSTIHEERLLALLLLIQKYVRAEAKGKTHIYHLYLRHTRYINNWDLIDLSAEHIVGAFLRDKSKKSLYRLARSKILWERRIAILATFHFIKQNSFSDALKIITLLRNDTEDLIHKAAGWMLREIGKRNQLVEERFLKTHYKKMPRTMLRYAIEKFPEFKRQAYLKGTIPCTPGGE